MKFNGFNQVQPIVRSLKKRLSSTAVILMYHRVADVAYDPWGLCVTPTHFCEQMAVLREYSFPIQLRQLVQQYKEGENANKAVVVTFDDGYADNLYNAKPILERYDVPATVFLASGQLNAKREFWWDKLEQLLLHPDVLPETFYLKINGQYYTKKLGKAAYHTEKKYSSTRPWDAEPDSRLAFYHDIWQLLLPLPLEKIQHALLKIATWAGAKSDGRPDYWPLSTEEAILLGQSDLIELGAHTVTHPSLSMQSRSDQQCEIGQCKADLEELLNRPVTSFSYPHGEYTAETRKLVQQAGFTSACTVEADNVWSKSDPFQLPRFAVEDWDGDEFARRLRGWL